MIPLLAPLMKQRSTAAWVEAFEAAAVPCGPINTIDQVFANEQVLARGLKIGLTREDGSQVPGVANPIVLSETPPSYEKCSPLLGMNTADVLSRILNIEAANVEKLRSDGIIT